jgi:hypothetical protein
VQTATRLLVRRPRLTARTLLVAQVSAIAAIGLCTVFRFPVFAAVDERAHLAYVQEVAEDGRMPWVGRNHVFWQELAIEARTYPRASGLDPARLGLRGSSYEGWQPPLYYVLAAPAFEIPGDYRHKVYAVRAFDLLLLGASVALVTLLARAVFEDDWIAPCCAALLPPLWPGVLVRSITTSNVALEMPIVPLYLLAIWHATRRSRPSLLLAAGGLLGLCLLTQLTLLCLAPLLLPPLRAHLRARRDAAGVMTLAAAVALPLVLVAPWLGLNESRYGALTAGAIEERITAGYLPPGPHGGLGAVLAGVQRFGHALLPQEWWPEYRGTAGIALIALVVLPLLALAPLLARPRLARELPVLVLGSPLLLGLATLIAIMLAEHWSAALFPRYLSPMIAPFVLCGVWLWRRRTTGVPHLWILRGGAMYGTALTLVWIYLAGAPYFVHLGAHFGIRAAA